jgi:hypothetical protein
VAAAMARQDTAGPLQLPDEIDTLQTAISLSWNPSGTSSIAIRW